MGEKKQAANGEARSEAEVSEQQLNQSREEGERFALLLAFATRTAGGRGGGGIRGGRRRPRRAFSFISPSLDNEQAARHR
jgi:hypothetical protein